jgi:hypothetical protein
VGAAAPTFSSANRSALAERWAGENWTLQAAANPPQQPESELEDVSCASSTMCGAVGYDRYREKGFIEIWNGSGWKVEATSYPGEMKAISCPTTTWCMTVAKNENKLWRVKWFESLGWMNDANKPPPTPSGATQVSLRDVSCTSEAACTVVGSYYAGGYKPYVARWDGTGWTLQSAPGPVEGDASEAMLSVSCTGSTFCVAVGKAAKKPFAERWNGSEWSVQTAPNPTGASDAVLEGVSCPTTGACMAVGSYQPSTGPRRTLAERWNGSTWTALASPNPAKEGDAKLRSVSCVSASSCIAAGKLTYPPFPTYPPQGEMTVAESWNGTSWTLQSSVNPEGKTFSSLAAVSCTSSVACTAVGAAAPTFSSANRSALAERWD